MSLNVSTFVDYNLDIAFRFIKEDCYIISDFQHNIFPSQEKQGEMDSVFNFCSETNKYVMYLVPSFFHFYTENFATLLFMYKKDPSLEVIIVNIDFDNKKILSDVLDKNEFKMFFLFLIDNNINYKIVDAEDVNNAKINNYFFYSFNANDTRNQASLLSEFSKKYVTKKDKKNKAYIRTGRIKNEHVLEKYLETYNFDIITIDFFDNFIDQMDYYYNCKVLLSATCGGMSNASFMDEGATIVELVTTIVGYSDGMPAREEVHHIYDTLSLQRDHVYVGISNINKTAEDIIQYIKNSKVLMTALEQ
jgi:hypothetical protein